MAAKRCANERVKWEKFAGKMKAKRRTTTAPKNRSDNFEKDVGGNIFKQRQFVVQLLESEPSGKGQEI